VAAVYRIELPLPDGVPPRMQALRFTHVSARVVMHLNGGLLYERGAALADAHAIRTLPLLVDVPPALLVPGRNLLELRVQHGQWQRAGLAGVSFGDRGLLAQAHQRYLLWQVDAPQIVNLLAMAVSTVLLLIWWLRRSEVALGLFGALFLITSFRNYGYFAELLIPAALADWMQFGGVLCGSLLLLPFLWRHGGWPQPRLERALLWTGAVLLLLGAGLMAVYPAGMFGLRLMVYPGTLALSVLACGVACRAAWRSRRGADLWIAVGLALIVVGSVHDFALLAGQLGMEAAYWTPYLTPVLLGVFSLQMVGRMLGAMDTAEQLSQALEQRVAQRTRELAAANDARNRFIAVASHDLRQPLNAVGLLVGTLRERIRFPEVRTLVDKIQASVDGMAALLQSLLDLSRLDVGGAAPRLDDVPLAGLLGALRAELEPLAQQRGLRLRFAPTRVVVRTDRALLAGMLRNLVGNAIRYTPQGAVLVGVRRRGASAWLQVIDTGLGIDPAEQALVFDEFYRGNAAGATQVPGAGLGLAIVRRSADALGHALVLRSAPGRGTLMAIELPLAAAGEAWPGAGAAPGADADSRRLVGNFVVVVEDDVLARDALGLLLRQWGCHVLAAPSAAQALAELQGHLRSPDLLLCDFHLGPGPDGLQAIDALRRAVGETVPALLMTAELPAAQRAAMGRQDVPMLAKPVTPTALLRALVACLDTPPTGAG
jgi:signal transduction histidine kinase/CheY-like chemotaxis protein